MSLQNAFPKATFIPFNPLWLQRLAEAKKDSNTEMIIIDSSIYDWSVVPQTGMVREHWVASNSIPTILEIGCQDGHLFLQAGYTQMDKWYGMDIDLWKMKHFTQGDAHKTPFKSKSFDTVVIAEILEHVKDPVQVVKEALRIASKRVIITTPNETVWGPTVLPFMDKYEKDKMDGISHRQQIDKNSRWLPTCLNPKDHIAEWDEDKYEHLWHIRHFYHKDDNVVNGKLNIPSGRTKYPEIDFVDFLETTCRDFDKEYRVNTLNNLHIEKIEFYPWGFLGAIINTDETSYMSRYEFIKALNNDDDWVTQFMTGENNNMVAFLRRI